MPSIAEWLKAHDLEQYASLFIENEVDLKTLQVLTDNDLKELGLPFGPRKRLLNALTREAQGPPPAAFPATGERRQLTLLFCDMVGFTELASRLDPEVLQAVIRAYEDACAACIARYDGFVFQRLGDGIVAFFGYPAAHEDDAERAIRAGLEIVAVFATLEVPHVGRLQVRIGIASGLVVVSSAEKGAVGESANLASRLQGIAQPGTIVVSERVRALAGGAFEYTDLGEHTLKGIARPTHAYRVDGVSAAASRFEAATGASMTPLVGREEELGLLAGRWQSARAGDGQVVLLSGEPGIGKSRILTALRERLEAEGAGTMRFQCSPYHVDSAFYPSARFFERALMLRREESADEKLDKLEALVVGQYGRPLEDVRFIAAVLSIPSDDRYGGPPMNPQRHKEETIRTLVDCIEAAARMRPTLAVFEDAHWADPSTLQVLDLLIDRARSIPLLVVLTHRPEFEPGWEAHGHVASLGLTKLTPTQSGALVSRLTGGRTLPPGLLDQIVARTDGVPLFVEELTRSILESGNLKEEADRYAYVDAHAGLAIPATLRDSLMARLDRVTAVKEIAQIGAAIGRTFSYEVLAAVAPIGEAALAGALTQLTGSGLAFQRGSIPQAVFTFKHALVQDTAYDSLLKSRRQELHARIARVLDERFPDTRGTEPELLARHYSAAGLGEQALPFWQRAGELALQRFALLEAIAHLRKGLAVVESLPRGPQRDLKELELRTRLGPAVVAAHGWASPEVRDVFEPAWALAESLGHRQSYLPLLHGLWVHFLTLARHAESLEWADTLLAHARASGDSDLEICGHRAAMASHFWMGHLFTAREHGDVIRSTYDPARHWHIAPATNADPLSAEGYYRGQLEWMLGYPDRAAVLSDAKDEHARRRNHPFDVAFALTVGAQVYDYRSEPEKLLARADEAERVGREHHIPLMSEVMAQVVKGVAWLRAGRIDDSVAQLQESLARLDRTGHRAWVPYLKAVMAEALARTGDVEGGLAVIEDSLARIEQQDERVHLAEVLRLKGWMLQEQGRLDEAEQHLRAAIDVARGQQAKSWELRASTTLARLLADRGNRQAARDLLAPVYAWFTEGFETKDLKDAKTLLDELDV